MGAKTERVERRSQATPLAEDIIAMLQGQLSEGAFGTGVGPLQRQAGTSMQQLVSSLQQRAQGGGGGINPDELIKQLTIQSQEGEDRGAAGLREQFGAAGARFGSQVGQAEGDFRRGVGQDLNLNVAQTLLQSGMFNAQQGLQENDQLLNAIQGLFGQGQANTQPFFSLAQQGILPEEIIQKPSVLGQILTGALTAGGAILGGPAGAAIGGSLGGIFGGGAGQQFSSPGNLVPNGTGGFMGPAPIPAPILPQGVGGTNGLQFHPQLIPLGQPPQLPAPIFRSP